jgi:cytochrome c553
MQRILTVIALGMTAITPPLYAADYTAEVTASRETAQEFMQTLKQELQAAMQEGGPVNAVSVCNLTAPAIASTYSIRNGWDVGRTSLKTRNPGNTPDAWERAVLVSFEERKRAGEDPAMMEFYEVVSQDGSNELRYMKAIPTAPLCLACHGQQLDSIVKTRIETLYPQDQALGYQEGDIRGAFSITQPLSSAGE